MEPKIYHVLEALNQADIDENLLDGKRNRIVRSETLLSAEYFRKKGTQISMGMGSGPDLVMDLESGKKKAVLFVVNMEEYEKFSKQIKDGTGI